MLLLLTTIMTVEC